MLLTLNVKNFAIIDNIQIDFENGFTVLTGETGAGKSLIIDAISLLFGERASNDLIRYGEQKAIIEGTFSNYDDKIKLFSDVYMNVIETPGHCPSCLTYYTDKHVFTGDSYIPGVNVVTKLPKGSKIQAKESLDRILTLSENREVHSGHDVEKWFSYFN